MRKSKVYRFVVQISFCCYRNGTVCPDRQYTPVPWLNYRLPGDCDLCRRGLGALVHTVTCTNYRRYAKSVLLDEHTGLCKHLNVRSDRLKRDRWESYLPLKKAFMQAGTSPHKKCSEWVGRFVDVVGDKVRDNGKNIRTMQKWKIEGGDPIFSPSLGEKSVCFRDPS